MKALIQRVKKSSVTIDGEIYSKIESGMLIFLAVEKSDAEQTAEMLAEKLLKLRIFEDNDGKMNKSVVDIKGDVLVVSQFTLAADCKKGTRPSFDNAAEPEIAQKICEYFVACVRQSGLKVKTGKFRADMDVELVNDGPVTFMIEKQ